MMKKLSTKKLFFSKWPYKIECNVNGAHLIKLNGVDWVKRFCIDESSVKLPKNNYRYDSYKKIEKPDLLNFANSVADYVDHESVQIRNEGRIFNLYTDKLDIVHDLEKKLSWCIDCVYYPDSQEEAEFLANNKNKVICDVIPYGKYTHKVTFKDRIPRDKRLQYWTWIIKYDQERNMSWIAEPIVLTMKLCNEGWQLPSPTLELSSSPIGDAEDLLIDKSK